MIGFISKFIASKLSGYVALGLLAALVAGGLYVWVLHAQIESWAAKHGQAVTLAESNADRADQNMALFNACKDNFQINKKVIHDLKAKNNDTDARAERLNRMLRTQCIPIDAGVLPGAAGGADGAADNRADGRGGIDARALVRLGHSCQDVVDQLNGWIDWAEGIKGE